jgi:hypothetical protein
MSSARLPALVEEKRGHCHEIGNIYGKYLNGILSNVFNNPGDRQRVEEIFVRLNSADGDLFGVLAGVAERMRNVAKEAYRFKLTGKRQDAIDLISGSPLDLLDMRDRLNDASITMRQIASEFIKASRVAPI